MDIITDKSMAPDEVELATRMIKLLNKNRTATRNYWVRRRAADRETIFSLQEKGHVVPIHDGWMMTKSGLEQLKLHIGPFSTVRKNNKTTFCETCGGSGYTAGNKTCDFCSGSGWMSVASKP